MKIARVLYPVKVLGPGNRIAIWTSGCSHGCTRCANPELWKATKEQEVPFRMVKKMIESIHRNHPVDGFTITGGDPMGQPEALKELIEYLLTITEDILVYSGYTKEELLNENNPSINYILESTAVFIDGKYEQELNLGHPLKGSENQVIYYKNPQYKERYEEYINDAMGKMRVQNFTVNGGIISVGIHKPDFNQELDQRLEFEYQMNHDNTRRNGEKHE
jgi:anaerobic ribonucleoside-triphosphate reductase activating protein